MAYNDEKRQRIAKLLALARSTSFPAEAQAAREAALRLTAEMEVPKQNALRRRKRKGRDPRFAPHEDILEGILGWGSDGTPYTPEDLHEGLAEVFEMPLNLQFEEFPNGGQIIWVNYVAHALRAFTIEGVHEEFEPGRYRLTELGMSLAKKFSLTPEQEASVQAWILKQSNGGAARPALN